MLLYFVEWTALIPLCYIFVAFLLQIYISKRASTLRCKAIKFEDERIKLLTNILTSIKTIKLHTWEDYFLNKIQMVRGEELRLLQHSKIFKILNYAISLSTPLVSTFLLLFYREYNGYITRPNEIFTIYSLLNSFTFPLIMLPATVRSFYESKAGLERLDSLLKYHEMVDQRIMVNNKKEPPIQFKDVTLLKNTFKLEGLNFTIHKKQKIAVFGGVGCGKSTFLGSLLGEVPLEIGSIKVNGKIAFVSQEPWLINASIKDNILFDQKFNAEKYKRVLEICELVFDLNQLPEHGETIIDEQGENLSGGQKQRITLARALYVDCDLLVLDDPLSSLDNCVAQTIMNGVMEYSRNKVVIMVTNQPELLEKFNSILFISNSCVSAFGTFESLMKDNPEFASMINKFKLKAKPNRRETKVTKKEDISALDYKLCGQLNFNFNTSPKQRWTIYWNYFVLGGYSFPAIVFGSCIIFCICNVWINWELTHYGQSFWNSFGGLICFVMSLFLRGVLFVHMTCKCSSIISENACKRVFHAPIQFFHLNPLGSILSRLQQDQNKVDAVIPDTMLDFIHCSFQSFSTISVLIWTVPSFLILFVLLIFLFYYLLHYFLALSKELTKLESVSASPIISHISSSLKGVESIRSFGATTNFKDKFVEILDNHHSIKFLNESLSRWIGLRIDFIGGLIITITTICLLLLRNTISPAIAIFTLSSSNILINTLQWAVRTYADTENQMISVERLFEYNHNLPQEPYESSTHTPPTWPTRGDISFKNVHINYQNSPNVNSLQKIPDTVRDINLFIKHGNKIGIVGRTGAGKTTLALSLFRLFDCASGSIEIDNIDISKIGLTTLRSKIAIIPQDPVLFQGTILSNLDPLNIHNPKEIRKILSRFELMPFIDSLGGLDVEISEAGGNLSVGQKQLLCIARALLMEAKIIVLDEATSHIDLETEKSIQKSFLKGFADSTVIMVAHRFQTIINCNIVLVMDTGKIVEMGPPKQLLNDPNSLFSKMVEEAEQ
uniref:ABC transporter domain-containing protein n=1 Tax=Arcella intermedia TaxID=1963864 RepID=A0A6B2KX06_9EUKA